MSTIESVQEQGVSEFLFDVDDLITMGRAGLFPDGVQVELIDGRVVMAPSEGSEHIWSANRLVTTLHSILFHDAALKARYDIVQNGTLPLARRRAVQPDLMVVPKLDPYRLSERRSVLLAVEVAVTSIRYDEGLKRRMYAEAEVAELWIVEPERRRVLVCREPTPRGYADVVELGPDGLLSPPFAPDQTIAVAEIVL